ncbi:MAG: hypothetical protein QOE63_643 [Acidimicrobiaceae bacterium]|jgi:uncharacterized membrane protein YjdF
MTRERITILTGGAIASFAAFGIARGDHRVWAYLVVTSVLVTATIVVDRRVRFSAPVLGVLCSAMVLHLSGGLLPGPNEAILYDQWLVPGVLKYDQLVHFINCAALALACFVVLRRWLRPGIAPAGPAFAAAAMACGLGAVNEVFEYLASLLFHDLDVGGYDNTGWDLVFNLAGALTMATWLALSGRPQVHDVADRERAPRAVGLLDDEVARIVDVDRDASDLLVGELDAHRSPDGR